MKKRPKVQALEPNENPFAAQTDDDLATAMINLRKKGRRLNAKQKEELSSIKKEQERREKERTAAAEIEAEELQRIENDRRDAAERRSHLRQVVKSAARVKELAKDAKIVKLVTELASVKSSMSKRIADLEKETEELRADNAELSSRLAKVEGESETRFLRQEKLSDEINGLTSRMATIQKEAETHNEHMSEMSTNLNQQLSYTQLENRVLRIERRNQEADFSSKLRELQVTLMEKLDVLIKHRASQHCTDTDRENLVKEFLTIFDEKDDEYAALLKTGQDKVKNLHDFFYQLQPMHSNLPSKIRVQLQALSKQQLFLLLDVLACYEPVMRFLYSKFPPF
eukprot:TRINITY_DN113766_c0_g1_i1.p1 TRINITY_DN113766_c0_g1~~TRINITY_DN113766_c0_g1_i1.p1  ORF type:complete len:350 (+),score=34.57 TRINITY_DN113766_c0_g1_i1:31-1050(+)